MSHAATKWAFDQPEIHRDMKPSEWAVLMVLADCHNPVNGCFPSQDYICAKTNLGERAVRDQLTRLKQRGLINWEEARENGRRGSNRYSLGFEPGFQPAKSAGGSTGENEQLQPADSDSFNRQNLPPNLVKEPVREPLREARTSEKEDRKAIEKLYWKLIHSWPNLAGSPQDKWLNAWLALTPDERLEAAAKRDAWVALLRANGKDHIHVPGTYFENKLWKQVPDAPVAPPENSSRIEARPFSNPFIAEIYRNLLLVEPVPQSLNKIERMLVEQGRRTEAEILHEKRRDSGWPAVSEMFEKARGWRPSAARSSLVAVFPLLVAVRVGSDEWEEWKAFHWEQGWPWFPDPGKLEWVHFPSGGPAGLNDFEAALRGLGDDDGR